MRAKAIIVSVRLPERFSAAKLLRRALHRRHSFKRFSRDFSTFGLLRGCARFPRLHRKITQSAFCTSVVELTRGEFANSPVGRHAAARVAFAQKRSEEVRRRENVYTVKSDVCSYIMQTMDGCGIRNGRAVRRNEPIGRAAA